jgi:hypothetical protein
VLESEPDVGVPARADRDHRVAAVPPGGRVLHVLGEPLVDDRVEQALLAAEVVVQRRRLHAGPLADRPRRHVPVVRLLEQLRGREQQPVPGGAALRIGTVVGHGTKIVRWHAF